MKLENQVVSLELSKKFKKLGLNQESLFYWGVPKSGNIPEGQLNEGLPIKNSKMYKFRDYYSAFTVAESDTPGEAGGLMSGAVSKTVALVPSSVVTCREFFQV